MKTSILFSLFIVLASASFYGAADATTNEITTNTSDIELSTVPSSSPSPPSTPSPQPKPKPSVETVNKVDFKYESNNTVAIGGFQGTFHLTVSNRTIDVTLNNLTVLDKNKSELNSKQLVLTFDANGSKSLTFAFHLEKTDSAYALNNITVDWNSTELNTFYSGFYNGTLFNISIDHSFCCLSSQTLDFIMENSTKKEQTGTIKFDLSNFTIDAFRSSNSTNLPTISECDLDAKNKQDYVPLAVGASLIALVVIVLIAFMIGRKRSRRLAYESV